MKKAISLTDKDLSLQFDLKDASVDELLIENLVNRIPHGGSEMDGFFLFFTEVQRVLKKGGIARVSTPYHSSASAFFDPRATRIVSDSTFHALSKKWRQQTKFPDVPVNLEIVGVDYAPSVTQKGKSSDVVQQNATHLWNTIDGVIVTLKKP